MSRTILAALAALAALCAPHVQASTPQDTHYVAAVVDYFGPSYPELGAEANMLKHIENLGKYMADAAAQNVDILVFPEEGLRGPLTTDPFPIQDVPDGADKIIPCNRAGQSKPLSELSCLAIKHKMYLVVNLVHQVPCTAAQDAKCPTRGYYNYNTNVAFDRQGMVVARYHKYNLFGERNNNVPPSVEYVTFDTDFGVRFGMFICFDILFDQPAAQLARVQGVTDFVFSAAWFSEVPFLSAVQAHSAWAHSLDVTLLAAAFNNPAVGATGSGIYRGRDGIIDYQFNPRCVSTMLVGKVPKHAHWQKGDFTPKPAKSRFDVSLNYHSGSDPYDSVKTLRMIQDNLTMYTTELLPRNEPGTATEWNKVLTNNGFKCSFYSRVEFSGPTGGSTSAATSIHGASSRARALAAAAVIEEAEAADADGIYYRAVAFNGVRDHSGVATTGVQVCGIVSCLNKQLSSCGWNVPHLTQPTVTWTKFNNLRIKADYSTKDTLQFASTQAGPRYDPLPEFLYDFSSKKAESADTQEVNLFLKSDITDLRTFAIYGRNFAVDGQTATGR